MKYYSRLVLDIATGKVLETVPFEYDGPIAELKGGGSSTTTVSIPPPTAEELDDRARARATQDLQAYTLGYKYIKNEDGTYSLEPRLKTQEELDQEKFDKDLQKQIRQRLLGGPVDEETKKLVGETFDAAGAKGNQRLEQFVREMAGARGLDLRTDSPILKELSLGKADLESQLRGAESASLLDSGNRAQLFAQALNEFQTMKNQQAFINRSSVGDAFADYGSQLAQLRGMQTTQTTRTRGGGGGLFGDIFGGLGATGGFLQGLGAIGRGGGFGAIFSSSRDFKEDIRPVKFGDEALELIEDTPIHTWRYKKEYGDDKLRIGPMTQEAPAIIVNKDGKTLDVVSYLGLNMAGLKALNLKVKRLEAERE